MTEIEFSASSLSYATFDALPFISMVDLYAINPTAECLELATESTEQVPDLGIEENGLNGEMNYTPGICTLSTKQNVCRWPTPSVQKLNSWTCRNCFRLRAYYELRTYWIKEFNYEDYIDLKFVGPVVPLKWSHPVAKVVDIGKNTYRVLFSSNAHWANKVMEFSIEFRKYPETIMLDVADNPLKSAKSCPCHLGGDKIFTATTS